MVREAAMNGGVEFSVGHFGDVRREAIGAMVLERVVTTGSLVLSRIGGDRNGQVSVGNFLGSPHVTPEEIIKTAARRTAGACAGRRIVVPQDTTEINFSGCSGGVVVSGRPATGRRQGSSAMRRWQSMPMTKRCSGWCMRASGRAGTSRRRTANPRPSRRRNPFAGLKRPPQRVSFSALPHK